MSPPRPRTVTPPSVPVQRPAPPRVAESSVEVIDRYQLVARLGKGGMAEVFRAKLQSIGGFERDVALKVLLPAFAAEPEFVEMLLDEARIAGAIDHPNVLQVLDVGRKGDIFYLVMEYVDGKDLRSIAKLIPGGRIPLGMALYVVSELLRGLHAVHTAVDERGQPRRIVHRDISPGNVMIDRRGFVKLGDFGIARASGRITRTRVGAVKGKSRYMSPEQLGATPIDHRADLYSVGVTLMEAILGDFARQSSRPTIYGPMFTWPERLPQGAIPPEVEAILRKAITETPERRYRDALAFRDDLEGALHAWAPGYNADTLARELARLLGGRPGTGASRTAPDAAPVDKKPVSVRPVPWRGIPTAQHSALPSASSTDVTPIQLASAAHASITQAPLDPIVASFLDDGFALEGEQTAGEAHRIPAEMLAIEFGRNPERRPNRRLVVGLIVAALALITVALAALVAATGTGGAMPAPEAVVAPRPQAIPAPRVDPYPVPVPRAMPISSSGAIEVLGPRGAAVRINRTDYPAAPTRIELPPGDYLLRMRVGRTRRLVMREVHVLAGRTTTIR